MKIQLLAAIVLIAMAVASPLAQAGALDNLKNNASNAMQQHTGDNTNSQAGAGALMSQLSSGSLNLGSPQNVAGVLGYCKKQGYAQSTAKNVKSRLMSKLGGQSETQDNDSYKQGLSGILQGNKDQRFNLSNLKDRIGQKVCGGIAHKAMSSFLGG